MRKPTRGSLLILLGSLLLTVACGIHILQERQDRLAGQNASILLSELDQALAKNMPSNHPEAQTIDTKEAPDRGVGAKTSNEPTFSGYSMAGCFSAPSVNIRLPILSDWSYDLLNVAPCRYSGSAENGNLILLGHNYKTHLKPLAQVETGAEVEFTAVDGTVYRYIVVAVDTIRGTDVDALASDHALNIFTCTRDRMHRIVVRCSYVSE